MRYLLRLVLPLVFALILSACGGETTPSKFTVGGSVTGMSADTSLTLSNNTNEQLVVTGNVPFTFSNTVAGTYSVEISKNPYWQSCSVSNGSGIAMQNISNVAISCAAANANVTTVYAVLDNGNPAGFEDPSGVAVDAAGNVYVTDSGHNSIRKISLSGLVTTTLAGPPGSAGGPSGSTDGTGAGARFNYPIGIAVDSGGNVFVTDANNHTIRKLTSAGVVTTIAGMAGVRGSADGTGAAALFDTPGDVAIGVDGSLYVADSGNFTIRMISPAGVVTTIAGTAGVTGSTDAVGPAASFQLAYTVAVDSSGNLFVGDGKTIRKISPGGIVTTFAGSSSAPPDSIDGTGSAARFAMIYDIDLDSKGNLYVVDGTANTIRRITTDAVVTTVAGTARVGGHVDAVGTAARFSTPSGVAVDADGNVFVADLSNKAIRKISPIP